MKILSASAQGYMEATAAPGILLSSVIAPGIGGSRFLIAGFLPRWAALGLPCLGVVAAVIFPPNFSDQIKDDLIHKRLCRGCALFLLYAHAAGAFRMGAKRA